MTTLRRVLLVQVVHRPILAGRAAGEADRSKIEDAVRKAAPTGVCLIDLADVEVMSSSYFDAAVWPVWRTVAEDVFPMLANVSAEAADDIKLVLKGYGAAVWMVAATAKASRVAERPRLLGELDPPLAVTLELVVNRGSVTAGDLAEVNGAIGATAWSNRLAALHQMRLMRRHKDGRRLIYSPAWEE